MFGLTKKDLEVFFDVVMDIGEWAFNGFYPLIPDLTDTDLIDTDFASAEFGVKPNIPDGSAESSSPEAIRGDSAGENPAAGAICSNCNGTGNCGVYGGSGGSMSYYMAPCPVCNNPLMEAFKNVKKTFCPACFGEGSVLSGEGIRIPCDACSPTQPPISEKKTPFCMMCGGHGGYGEPLRDSVCAKCQFDYRREFVCDECYGHDPTNECWACHDPSAPSRSWYYDDELETLLENKYYADKAEMEAEFGNVAWWDDAQRMDFDEKESELCEPDYDNVETWETPRASDYLVECDACHGTGMFEGSMLRCSRCDGVGKIVRDMRIDKESERSLEERKRTWGYHFCPNGNEERPYAALLCSMCRGIDPKTGERDATSYGVMKSRIEELEKENKYLHEALSEMGKIFRKYRDTGKVV